MGCDYGLCVMLRTVGLEALLKAIQGCYRMVVRLLGLPLRRQRGVTLLWSYSWPNRTRPNLIHLVFTTLVSAAVSLVTPHDGHDRHLSGSGPAPSSMLIGPGAGPTGTSRATTELHGAVRSDTAGPCAGCAAVPAAVASTGTMFWARAAVATRRSRPSAPSARIRPRTSSETARVWRETLWAREVWGPRRHTGRERAVPPWEEAPRSCVRQCETLRLV